MNHSAHSNEIFKDSLWLAFPRCPKEAKENLLVVNLGIMPCSISTLFAWAGPFPRAFPWSSLQHPAWDEASTWIGHLESELHPLWLQAWPGLQWISIHTSTKDALGQSCPGWALLHEICGWKWGTMQPGHVGLHHSLVAQHTPADLGLLPDIISSPSVHTYSPREGLGPVKVIDLHIFSRSGTSTPALLFWRCHAILHRLLC